MKALIFNLLTVFSLLSFSTNGYSAISPIDYSGRYTKEKKISREFKVSRNALLKVDNSYGNIEISTWDKNVVLIEVFIKANGNDEKKVKEKLDEIEIEFKNSSSMVMAKTHFEKENSSWWDALFGNMSNVNMEINYIIKAPITNSVDLNNDYGNIYIDKLEGNSKINCDYGSLDLGSLLGNSNNLNLDYSRNSQIDYVKRATINSDYSDIHIGEALSLDIKADYTHTNIRKVELLKFNCDYGSMKVAKAKKIIGNGDYLSTKIGQVHQSLDLNFDYGSAEIEKIIKGVTQVEIKSDYTNLKIGYANDHAFKFTVSTSYGNVKGLDNFTYNKEESSSYNKSYSGYHLNKTSDGSIKVNTNYGNVEFISK